MTLSHARLQPHWPLLMVIALFVLTVLFVNPLRETAIGDDWAYALTVRHLVETGEYRPHEALAANFLFQAYWGALFARVFGFSYTVLRVSTLVLLFAGTVAFYLLAGEHGLSRTEAGVLTLALISSPLVLRLSFTFMTDAPFMAAVIIALWLDTRAIRLKSLPLMFLGSMAASAAILTRQFGAAFVPGLLVAWWVSGRQRDDLALYLAGAALPAVATGWQFYMGTIQSTWVAEWYVHRQVELLARPLILLQEIPWRIMVFLHYMALSALALIIPALAGYLSNLRRRQREGRHTPAYRRELTLLAGIPGFLLASGLYGTLVMDRPGVLPLIPWSLYVLNDWPRPLVAGLTLITLLGAFLFARMMVLRYLEADARRSLTPGERLVDGVTVFLLILQLVFVGFADKYLLALIPCTLIIVGRHVLREAERRVLRLSSMVSLLVLVVAALLAREMLEVSEAYWSASERIRKAGVQPEDIFTNWEWSSYYGAFDRYIDGLDPATSTLDGYEALRRSKIDTATYVVVELPDPPPSSAYFTVIDRIPYQNAVLQTQYVYILKRLR